MTSADGATTFWSATLVKLSVNVIASSQWSIWTEEAGMHVNILQLSNPPSYPLPLTQNKPLAPYKSLGKPV